MGSELPGGYSTVIIRPSLPGRVVRSFDRSCVTLASCATSVPDMRNASSKMSFVNVIDEPFDGMTRCNASCALADTSGLGVAREFLLDRQPIITQPTFVLRSEPAKSRRGSRRAVRYCREAVFFR